MFGSAPGGTYEFSNSMADVLIGSVIMPIGLYQECYGWPPSLNCKAWVAVDIICCTASCMSLMTISMDRCFVCIKPIPPRWYDDKTAVLISLGM